MLAVLVGLLTTLGFSLVGVELRVTTWTQAIQGSYDTISMEVTTMYYFNGSFPSMILFRWSIPSMLLFRWSILSMILFRCKYSLYDIISIEVFPQCYYFEASIPSMILFRWKYPLCGTFSLKVPPLSLSIVLTLIILSNIQDVH